MDGTREAAAWPAPNLAKAGGLPPNSVGESGIRGEAEQTGRRPTSQARKKLAHMADRHLPRPGDGQIRDSTLSLRGPNPGRSHGHSRDTPRPPSLPRGNTAEENAPSLRRTRPTPTPRNTQLRKYRPARWVPRSAGATSAFLRSPAARGPGGETPPASGPG